MESQPFLPQNVATTTHSPSITQRSAEAHDGKVRSIEGRSEVRVDPAQNRIRAPRSRAEQLNKFVAQFQADAARYPGNVATELAGQTPMVNRAAPVARPGLSDEDQQKVEQAIKFGAEGIGLTRAEHMFFAGNRIDSVREMILADDDAGRAKALKKICLLYTSPSPRD